MEPCRGCKRNTHTEIIMIGGKEKSVCERCGACKCNHCVEEATKKYSLHHFYKLLKKKGK